MEANIRTGEAAAILGISAASVRRACDDGRLPWWSFEGSNQRFIRREDVLAFKEHGYVVVKARLQP